MSSLVATTMSPEDMIFTFKQKNEESFKEAWSRIYDWHGKTEPKMTLSLLLSCFYFGLALCYRYALDAMAEGDFLHCDGDQAFNIIKKLITIYSMPTDFDSSLVSIFNTLDTLESHTACLNDCYSTFTTRKNVIRGVQNFATRGVWLYATAITPLVQSYPWRTACTPRL
jgi:hypothetical protein